MSGNGSRGFLPVFSSLIALIIFSGLHAQPSEIDRLMQNELRMTFPSIYFKHNSTEYAAMPYTVDSCFRHIAKEFDKDVTALTLWRDSSETEELTVERMKILKRGLNRYLRKRDIKIQSMGERQKVSRQTISLTTDSSKIAYLLSLNSVLDVSKTIFPVKKKNKGDHVMHPRIGCVNCWMAGFHIVERHKRKKKAREKNKSR
jgi:hypothetical protein